MRMDWIPRFDDVFNPIFNRMMKFPGQVALQTNTYLGVASSPLISRAVCFGFALAVIWMMAGANAAVAQSTPGQSPRIKAASVSGEPFQDCDDCPKLIVIPPGSFIMGSAQGKRPERPPHRVVIDRHFAMSVFEITFDEYEVCVAEGTCPKIPDDHKWGRGQRPVINIAWAEAVAYTEFLSAKTSATYRLPTESEWEYAARAGTTTAFWWGKETGDNMANCRKCGSEWDGDRSAPVGSFPPNPLGLHDMNGNIWEWISDCWNPNHAGAPDDGASRQDGNCSRRVIRSGSWYYIPRLMSAHARDSHPAALWSYNIGIRVVRELP